MEQSERMFGPERAELLVEAMRVGLTRAYEALCERHDVHLGDDGHTFGVGTWKIGGRQVSLAIGAAFPDAVITWHNGSLRIELDGRVMHFYRGGPDGDSIEHYQLDGTITKRQIRLTNRYSQLSWPITAAGDLQLVMDKEYNDVPNLVVLHTGTPDTGLRSIHVCAATSLDGDDTTWLFQEQVWPERVSQAGVQPGEDVTPHDEGPRPELVVVLRDEDEDKGAGA